MLADIRFALRLFTRQPGFTLAAVLTLALGIGANTAIFSVAWQMLYKPLPYPNADRLVQVWEAYGPQDRVNPVAPGNYFDWVREARPFDSIAAFSFFKNAANLTGVGEPEQLTIRNVTGSYFAVFAMPPLLGRVLDDRDMARDGNAVVLSEGLWRRRFGADRHIIGREIRLADQPSTVVGVMPEAFEVSGGQVDAWGRLGFSPQGAESRGGHYLYAVATLKPGVSLQAAIADVKAVAARAATRFPLTNKDTSSTVTSIQAERGGTLRAGVTMLAWAAAVVLLIACANLASLQLARGVARGREFGIRAALGASRRRLMTQILIESLLIATTGAAAGLWLSSRMLGVLASFAPPAIRSAAVAGVDGAIIAYAIALAVASACLFAMAPAWRAATGASNWLRQRTDTGDRRTAAIRTVLVTAQIALAVVLLTGATLLVTSLTKVLRVDPGFDAARVLSFDVSLPQARFDTYAKRAALLDSINEAVQAVPGVTAACAINTAPFDEDFNMTYVPEGQEKPVSAFPRNVTARCFDVLGIRLDRGRLFTDHETARVGIVTAGFARAAWPGQDPIGRRVHLGVKDGALIEIVGVVNDSRQRSLEIARPHPQFYEFASEAAAFPGSRILVRAAMPPTSLFAAVREAVRRVDHDQPLARLRTLEDAVGESVSSRRFDLSLISSFSIVALVLSAIGIYGLLAQIVAQRTGEIGIRIALGASSRSIVRLVMQSAWMSVAAGVGVGVAGAVAASRLIRQFLFGVSPTDPVVYAVVAVALAGVAVVSAWIPARRAARVDPLTTLRS